MKILCAIPVVVDGNQLKRTLESVIDKPDVDVLIINNGVGDKSINHAIYEVCVVGDRANVSVGDNKPNAYVNRSWNQAISVFLNEPKYDHLILLNSDLKLQSQWDEVCRNRWEENPNEMLVPTIEEFRQVETKVLSARQVKDAAGIFITLSREQANLVYPLPEECKIWYGDTYIYGLCSQMYPISIVPNLLAQHEESSSIRQVPEAPEIIDQDKIAWAETVKPLMEEKIKQLKEPKRKELSLDYAIFSSDYFDLSLEDAMTKFPSHAEQIKDYFKINLERNNNAT